VPLPQGEDFSNHGLGDLIDRPANPGARIFKRTADDPPSPWGEGRVEGGRGSNLLNRRQRARDTASVKSNHRKHQSAFGNGGRF
jgi:hypothetical protein